MLGVAACAEGYQVIGAALIKLLKSPTFDVTLSAISQHLRVLRESGLVVDERRGRERVYQLNPEPLGEVNEWVTRNVARFWQRKMTALGETLKEH